MIELAEFRPEEINEAIEGLDELRDILAPLLRHINGDGMGEQDAQQCIRQLTLAKHALIAMGDFLEEKMTLARAHVLAKTEKDGRLVVQSAPAPGNTVWVVERDEDAEPIEISGYMFFAFVGKAAIVSSFINGSESIDETLEYHIEETLNNYDTDLAVFPKGDCYLTREEAEAALKKREPDYDG